MCLFQIAYQFFIYPFLSNRFSHLAIFRTGLALFCTSYLFSTLLHPLAAPKGSWGGLGLGAGLVITQVVRYGGSTLAYTAIAVMINCATPPALVGLANGVGQSACSLARCIGPILGGWVRSALYFTVVCLLIAVL
jgi:hypothetical protein